MPFLVEVKKKKAIVEKCRDREKSNCDLYVFNIQAHPQIYQPVELKNRSTRLLTN
jgi:hypothetical protein